MSGPATMIPPGRSAAQPDQGLPLRVRLSDGRIVERVLPARRHRSIHLQMLHAAASGYVELAAGRREHGRLQIHTRRRADHYVPPASNDRDWLTRLMGLADYHHARQEELFIAPAERERPAAGKQHVTWSRWLWLDLDRVEHLPDLCRLLQRKPAHMLVKSAGSGGLHAYWRLSRPLPALTVTDTAQQRMINPQPIQDEHGRLIAYHDPDSGRRMQRSATVVEWIERANMRMINAVGRTRNPDGTIGWVADVQCRDRSRLMRLAGSINGKTGKHARIMHLDLALGSYSPQALFGDLQDPDTVRLARRHSHACGLRRLGGLRDDPYRLIPAPVYFARLAGIDVPEHGNVCCPVREHEDLQPSCSVGSYAWHCHGCGGGWSIYDLASAVLGGPTGDMLAASSAAFARASQLVRDTFR